MANSTSTMDKSTLDLLSKMNDVNKKKFLAKAEVAKARGELAELKSALIKTGVLSEAQLSILISDINCW